MIFYLAILIAAALGVLIGIDMERDERAEYGNFPQDRIT